MSRQREMTAPVASVGADTEQSSRISTENSITQNGKKINSLETLSMTELYETVYPSKPPLIDGLLYTGAYLFVGAPKLGKSFLMAQLAYHISVGLSLWEHSVHKGTVLYLALEDDYSRLQKRLYRMFGTDSTENLHFAVSASDLKNGLEHQLQEFVANHSDTKLIIIDTLQKVREASGESYSYASDYEIIAKLKQFADQYGLCILLVHHTRKQQADDTFHMISGTTGLLGAADGALILQKEKRTSNAATLEVSGRDQQDQKLYLVRDTERLVWELEKAETELWKQPPDPMLDAVAALLTAERPSWNGTPTELVETLELGVKPNVLTLQLNVKASRLLDEYGVRYANKRSHAGRHISLTLAPKA